MHACYLYAFQGSEGTSNEPNDIFDKKHHLGINLRIRHPILLNIHNDRTVYLKSGLILFTQL